MYCHGHRQIAHSLIFIICKYGTVKNDNNSPQDRHSISDMNTRLYALATVMGYGASKVSTCRQKVSLCAVKTVQFLCKVWKLTFIIVVPLYDDMNSVRGRLVW